jgi:hypothetical protein
MSFELVHGGGEDIQKVFDAKISQSKMAHCVIDSDKSMPAQKHSSKYEKLKTIASRYEFASISSPPCRELENILTLSIIQLLPCGAGSPWNKALLRIAESEVRQNVPSEEAFWLYFDVKTGLPTKLESNPEDMKKWIDARFAAAEVEISHWCFIGFGSSVIKQFKDDSRANAQFRKTINSRQWLSIYKEFFIQLGWWFVSAAPIKT